MYNKGIRMHNRSESPSFDELLDVEREREKNAEFPGYNETIKNLLDILEHLQSLEPELEIVLVHQKVLAIIDRMIDSKYCQSPFYERSEGKCVPVEEE